MKVRFSRRAIVVSSALAIAICLLSGWISHKPPTQQINLIAGILLGFQALLAMIVLTHGVLAWVYTYKKRVIGERGSLHRELLAVCGTVATALSFVLFAASYGFSNVKAWDARHPNLWIYKTAKGTFALTDYGGGDATFIFVYTRTASSQWQLDTFAPGILPGQSIDLLATWPQDSLVMFHADGDEQWCAWQSQDSQRTYSLSQQPVTDVNKCFTMNPLHK